MSEQSLHGAHPTDLLPGFARGEVAESGAIEAHLASCEDCRLEVEVLRALAAPVEGLSDVERLRVYRSFETRRRAGGGRPGSVWLRASWRAAAGIALLLTSVGVWRVVQTGSPADWDPDLAIEGFAQELADLELSEGDVRIALGSSLIDDPTLDMPWEAEALDDLPLPWEQDR